MDPHTLELLDFPRILERLQSSCLSELGRERLGSESIATDPVEVGERLELARAFRRMLESGRAFPQLDLPDVRALRPKLFKRGVVLEVEELFHLGRFLSSCGRLKRHLGGAGEALLEPLESRLPELKELSRAVSAVIDRDGQVREDHIPALKELRERIRRAERDTERLAREFLNNPDYRTFWQGELPGQRSGRTVLPLRSNFKGRIPGIVHDVSSSGSTLYLEPQEMVERNNEIAELEGRYRRELHRILRELSAQVLGRSAEIQQSLETLAELDALYARADYAIRSRCRAAEPGGGEIELIEARHPLLKDCVPVSLKVGGGYRVLIVTGPNTGGKTVTLKTVGLLALMNQFGTEIPAGEGSRLPVFDDVLADIGDEQSIEQSLSTFSAHIGNIARMVAASTRRSLVLFDELGAGTDPEEGVAIAMALLDHFIEKGCVCLATTHHGILKNYGYSREGVENASMGFDRRTLTPTFRIHIGIPGESHALEIAQRSGIGEELLERARKYLREERGDAAELIRSLSDRQRELLEAEEHHRERESAFREKLRETDLRDLRLRQRELELKEHGLGEIRRLLRESRSEFEHLVERLRQEAAEGASAERASAEGAGPRGEPAPAGGGQTRREAREFFRALEAEVDRQERDLERNRSGLAGTRAGELGPGVEVVVRRSGKRGRIIRRAKGEGWLVETDTLRASFPAAELEPAPPGDREQEAALSIREEVSGAPAAFELDVRGMRLEEAIRELERQLDRALLGNLGEFSVIHGMGEGVLQQGVHRYLKGNPHVKDYYFAAPDAGGFGKTIVRL
ncbi:MAG: Smr/MutS family protein [Spirochaetales bacterium]|nr:Smr/MutS family protein [Spirochaetales bacterium]